MKPRRALYWRQSTIDEVLADARRHLDQAHDLPSRLAAAMKRVSELAADAKPMGMLRRYVYCISALVHHERHGGLNESQVRGLSHVADSIVKVLSVKPGFSKGARLYSDLRLVQSQISRKDGKHLRAAWQQHLAVFFARANPIGGTGFQSLASATRALRLGSTDAGLLFLREAEETGLHGDQLARARFERLRALRLAGRLDEADTERLHLDSWERLPQGLARDIEWEDLCREAVRTRSLDRLVMATGKKGTHRHGSYVLEVSLWAKAHPSKRWMERLSKVPTRSNRDPLGTLKLGTFSEAARILDQCYDTGIPLSLRLETLGAVLEKMSGLPSFDKELLVWSAACRWLSRSKAFGLARIAYGEYVASCLKLSAGASRDVLGFMGDLAERPWAPHS